MRHVLLFVATLSLVPIQAAYSLDTDAVAIKEVIPSATAMMRADFERLTKAQVTPKESMLEDKSLTLMIFTLKMTDDEKAKKQFRFDTNTVPRPKDLAAEAYRVRRTGKRLILLAPVTLIHKDRITDFTCKVDGRRATGTVSFKVPKLFHGEVDYVAQNINGKWYISEFVMPAYDIHLVRSNHGLWKRK